MGTYGRESTQRRYVPQEVVPTLNAFIRSTLQKGESGAYADSLDALAGIQSPDAEKYKNLDVDRLLARLLQHGHITIASVQPILGALKTAEAHKESKSLVRLIYFLVQLALGDGTAGTPLPMPFSKGNTVLPKAVDRFGPEVLSASWAHLSDDKSPFMYKQGALRALAALAHASLTSKPDDPMYVGGLLVTIQSLLDSLDTIQSQRNTLAGLIAQHGTTNKKRSLKDFRARMEVWALMRIAFSAARVALSKSGINKIAVRSFTGICSADAVGARHALALASLMARDPQSSGSYISEVKPALALNVELGKRTGQLFTGGAAAVATGPSSGLPFVSRDQPEGSLNLRDPWARIYLARGAAAAIQSGHIAGDLSGRGATFWEALQFLALADPSHMVALEAIRAMFGAPYPRAEPLNRKRGAAPGGAGWVLDPAQFGEENGQARVAGASWHMVMSVADSEPCVPHGMQAGRGGGQQGGASSAPGAASGAPTLSHMPSAAVGAPGMMAAASAAGGLTQMPSDGMPGTGVGGLSAMASGGQVQGSAGGRARTLFACVVDRIMLVLKSRQRSLIGAACKTVGVIAESRAWCTALSSGHTAESDAVQRQLAKLAAVLQNVLADSSLGACERGAAVEALIWLQEFAVGGGDEGAAQQPPGQLVSPGQLLKCMAQGGSSVPTIVRVLFADPWPEGLVAGLLASLLRCLRCWGAAAADTVAELALAAAAAAPSRMPREGFSAMLDAVPGPVGLKVASQQLLAPLPPIAQPNGNSPVEVKLLAAQEEAAFEGLRGVAAWWLGEHANQVASTSAWKPVGKLPVALSLGPGVHAPSDPAERMALAASAMSPVLAAAVSQLQRTLLVGGWELRLAAAQALAKIAVRSREPFRLQCYSALAATQQLGTAAAGGLPEDCDALGLALVVRPALEVLDAMYAGELVLRSQAQTLGRTASSWPKTALASLQRRHEYLLYVIGQRIGFVPRDVFFPLGPLSKRLLRPDDPLDEEEEEEEREYKALHMPKGLPKNILEAATAAAAAAVAAEQEKLHAEQNPQQYTYDEQYNYDQQYYDGQYADQQWYYDEDGNVQYYEGASYYGQEGAADPLATWQSSGAGALDAVAPKVAVYIPTENDAYYSSPDTPYDDEDFRWGTAQFGFSAEGEDEVSISTGERVKVLTDMGDWLYIVNSAGARGLVPASYVSVEQQQQQGGGASTPGSVYGDQQRWGSTAAAATPAAEQYYYGDQRQQSMRRGASDAATSEASGYSGAATGYGTGAGAGYYGATSGAAASYEEDESAGFGGAGGTAGAGSGGGYYGSTAYEQQPSSYAAPATSSYQQPSYAATPDAPTPTPPTPAPEGHPAVVMFDFTAEAENELTVRVGEQVVVGDEIDGWYQTMRLSDGVSGLIPASYVQLQE